MKSKKISVGLFGTFRLRLASLVIAVPADATNEDIAGLADTLGDWADAEPEALWSSDDGSFLRAGDADGRSVTIEGQVSDTEEVDCRFTRKAGRLVLAGRPARG